MVGMVTNGTMAGVLMNGMMVGVPLDGTKVGNTRMILPQARFRLEVWILAPRVARSGLYGENESGHRSCSEHIPLNFGPDGAGNGRFYRTASGDGFLMVELGNSQDTTKTDCSNL